jgi:O-antigen/teichoic acid export membrane protein
MSSHDVPSADAVGDVFAPDGLDVPEVRIGSGSALTLMARLIGLATSFLVGVLVARAFGPEGKGALAVIIQVPSLLVVALDLGMATSTVYFISRGELRPGTAAANSLLLAAVLSVPGGAAVYLLLSGPFAVIPGVSPWTTAVAICLLPLGLVSAWLGGISTGLSNLRLPFRVTVASSSTTLIGLAALVATGRGTITTVLALSAAGTAVGIIVVLAGLRRHLRPLRVDVSAARGMARFSAKAYLSSLAGLMHERQDVLVLGWLAGTAAVGLYSVAVSFAELTWFIPGALAVAILAKGSRRSESSTADYTTRTTRIAVLFMILTTTVSLFAVPLVIPVIYGGAFAPAMFAFFAILPGVFADGVTRILWSYQITRGRLYWRLSLWTMVLNLAVILALVPRFGAVGAALASSVSYTVLGVMVVRRFCADTGAGVSEVLLPQRSDFEVILRTAKQLVSRSASKDRA